MTNLNSKDLATAETVEGISGAVMDTLETLPEEFITFDEEEVVFIINLNTQWLSDQETGYLNKVFLMLYFMKMGDLWDLHLDPSEILYIKELRKVDQAVKNKGEEPQYYPVIPEQLKEKINHSDPSPEISEFVA